MYGIPVETSPSTFARRVEFVVDRNVDGTESHFSLNRKSNADPEQRNLAKVIDGSVDGIDDPSGRIGEIDRHRRFFSQKTAEPKYFSKEFLTLCFEIAMHLHVIGEFPPNSFNELIFDSCVEVSNQITNSLRLGFSVFRIVAFDG